MRDQQLVFSLFVLYCVPKILRNSEVLQLPCGDGGGSGSPLPPREMKTLHGMRHGTPHGAPLPHGAPRCHTAHTAHTAPHGARWRRTAVAARRIVRTASARRRTALPTRHIAPHGAARRCPHGTWCRTAPHGAVSCVVLFVTTRRGPRLF